MILILVATLLGGVCGDEGMSNEEIVRRLKTEIVPGMPRSVVEQKLERLQLEYVYVSRKYLEMIDQAQNGDVELSGRFDVSTQYENKGLAQSRVAIFVDLDTEGRVVEVRTEELDVGL